MKKKTNSSFESIFTKSLIVAVESVIIYIVITLAWAYLSPQSFSVGVNIFALIISAVFAFIMLSANLIKNSKRK